MAYKLILQRLKEYENVKHSTNPNAKTESSTIGEAKLVEVGEDGKVLSTLWKAYTCENGGPSTDTSKQDKRVVARKYQLRWSSSKVNGGLTRAYPKWLRGSKDCPIKIDDGTTGPNVVLWMVCKDKPEFAKRRMHWHSGTCPQHTEGCILPALDDNGNGTTSRSAIAVNSLFEEVAKVGVENIEVEILEIQ